MQYTGLLFHMSVKSFLVSKRITQQSDYTLFHLYKKLKCICIVQFGSQVHLFGLEQTSFKTASHIAEALFNTDASQKILCPLCCFHRLKKKFR